MCLLRSGIFHSHFLNMFKIYITNHKRRQEKDAGAAPLHTSLVDTRLYSLSFVFVFLRS